MVLRVNHDERVLAARGRQHLKNLPVVEPEGVVGHVDLERRVAGSNQRRQLLAGDLLGWVGDD